MTWRSSRRVLIGGNKRNICGLEAFPAGTPECVIVSVINCRVTATSRRANSFLFCVEKHSAALFLEGNIAQPQSCDSSLFWHKTFTELRYCVEPESVTIKESNSCFSVVFFVHIFLSAKHLMV